MGGLITFTLGGELICIYFETAFYIFVEAGGGVCVILLKEKEKAKEM